MCITHIPCYMDGKLSSNWTQLHRSIPSFAPLSYLHISSPTLLFSLPLSSLFLRPTGAFSPTLFYRCECCLPAGHGEGGHREWRPHEAVQADRDSAPAGREEATGAWTRYKERGGCMETPQPCPLCQLAPSHFVHSSHTRKVRLYKYIKFYIFTWGYSLCL